MRRNPLNEFGFSCDCQGFQAKKKLNELSATCSHLLALHYWFDQRNKAAKWGKYKQEALI
jgi:hypothetical protein